MQNNKIKSLVYTAVFSAIICVITMTVKIPAAGGYYHTGDAVIYLAGSLLPFPYAIFAGAMGAAFADLFSGYALYILPTVIIKACAAVCFTSKGEKVLCRRNFIAVIIASAISIAGYFLAEAIILGNITGALVTVYGNLGQAIVSAVAYIVLGVIFTRLNLKKRLFL